MQVEDYSEIEPALLRPDLADFTGPFLVRAVSEEVPVQKIRRNVKAVIAVVRGFELPVSFDHNAVLAHQATSTAMPHIKAGLLQFFGHSGSTVAARRQAELVADVDQ